MIKCDSFAVIRKVFMPYTFHYIKYVSKSTAYIYSVFGFKKDSRKPVPWNVNIALNAPKIHVAKYIQFRTVVGSNLDPCPFVSRLRQTSVTVSDGMKGFMHDPIEQHRHDFLMTQTP